MNENVFAGVIAAHEAIAFFTLNHFAVRSTHSLSTDVFLVMESLETAQNFMKGKKGASESGVEFPSQFKLL